MDKFFLERRDIENSLRFYIMLSIVMANSDYSLNSEKSLNEFVARLKENNYDIFKINNLISQVSQTLPVEFRNIYKIPSSYMK